MPRSPLRLPRSLRQALSCALLLSLPGGTDVLAQQSLPPAPYAYVQLEDPMAEAQAQTLMESLRCLTCQSQSIADSDAPMAGDMRNEVRSRIAAGEDPEAIRAWLMERYGDYVSYKPVVNPSTWPLFAAPLLLILLAVLLLRRRFRKANVGSSEP
ncbi:cytochrome c-type biogenesis protein [Croceicoccus sp. F390]|uniref:Cytochrome c-type biogenesis protein n=1 Tax=Croceicoccus esteveae TaxID=3075597 RepID=A0ABU2ZJN4_9SPHN|nr:cytochrome c-type biogenesis protein [Croceicoccus sp. F390]MDT0576586.1 cytochrome c-type biogenesis protein [Croceicoccus sp. F390]